VIDERGKRRRDRYDEWRYYDRGRGTGCDGDNRKYCDYCVCIATKVVPASEIWKAIIKSQSETGTCRHFWRSPPNPHPTSKILSPSRVADWMRRRLDSLWYLQTFPSLQPNQTLSLSTLSTLSTDSSSPPPATYTKVRNFGNFSRLREKRRRKKSVSISLLTSGAEGDFRWLRWFTG
jgi:hypothetical protein